MSKSTTVGSVGYGIQSAKGSVTSSWSYHPATHINLAPHEVQQTLPLEIGGSLLPRGAYKGGVAVAGGFDCVPRTDTIGYLLYGLTGAATATASGAYYKHTFVMNSSDESSIPWVSTRRRISTDVGETYTDCKVSSAKFNLASGKTVTARFDVEGITPAMETSPSWSETYDDGDSFLVSCIGYVELAGASRPITSLSVEVNNALTTQDQEMIIGSYYMDDIMVTGRTMRFNTTYKWENATLYQSLLYGGSTTWDPQPYFGAMDFMAQSASYIGGSTRYALQFTAPHVRYMAQPIDLGPGNIVTMAIVGEVIKPSSGDAFTIYMLNNTATAYSA